ncbi:MAG: hypothetical protein OXF20_02665 [Gammaproteobacteria bacterium]|nr:hypothetical protein [Gammaproteobacteria bacterium]
MSTSTENCHAQKLPPPAGPGPGVCLPQPCFGRSPQDDAGEVAAGRGLSPGGLESGAGLGALSPRGRGDGESRVDLPACAPGPQGGRRPVPVPPAAGQEAELVGRPAFRPGPHSGAGGHCRAAGGGGAEEPHRRLGAGHDHRREAPGSAALPGGPDVEVHHPGAPGQQGLGARD